MILGCLILPSLGCEDAAELPGPSVKISVPDFSYVSAQYLSLDVAQDVAGAGGNHPITLFSEEQQESHSLIQVLGLDQKDNATSTSRESPHGRSPGPGDPARSGRILWGLPRTH